MTSMANETDLVESRGCLKSFSKVSSGIDVK